MLVTGSSSLSFAAGTREALPGRTWSYVLYPIAFQELHGVENPFELGGIRNSRKLRDLVRLLAYQMGSEVSYQEISRQLGVRADTVISYVVFRLGAFRAPAVLSAGVPQRRSYRPPSPGASASSDSATKSG